MRKTVCDICGKEMPEMLFGNIGDYKFCISSYGRIWDVCSDCRNDLNKWIEEYADNQTDYFADFLRWLIQLQITI